MTRAKLFVNILFVLLTCSIHITYAQTVYEEGFEPESKFNQTGFLERKQDDPLFPKELKKYLGYGCWTSSTGGVSVRARIGLNGSQGIQSSPNTAGNSLNSPFFDFIQGDTHTVSFDYARASDGAASMIVLLDVFSDSTLSTTQILDTLFITQGAGIWLNYTQTFEASFSGVARFRFVFNNLPGGQRIRVDNFRFSPIRFSNRVCDPNGHPLVFFEEPIQNRIPESNTTQQTFSIRWVGYENDTSRIQVEALLDESEAEAGLDYQDALPVVLTMYTNNDNFSSIPLFSVIQDQINETDEFLFFQLSSINEDTIVTDGRDRLSYEILDDDDDVTITPNAVEDSLNVLEDATLIANVLLNDLELSPGFVPQIIDSARHDKLLLLNPNGELTYVPDDHYFGRDSLSYRLSDGLNASDTAWVFIDILGVNDPPSISELPTLLSVPQDSNILQSIEFIANAGPNEIQSLSFLIDVEPPGSLKDTSIVEVGSEGEGIYTFQFRLSESFTDSIQVDIQVFDDGGTANGGINNTQAPTLNIIVDPEAPVLETDTYTVFEDRTLVVPVDSGVLSNDRSNTGSELTAFLENDTNHGTLTFSGDGSFIYVPNPDFFGQDRFTYRARDNFKDSDNLSTVLINVDSVNDQPIVLDLPLEINLEENQALEFFAFKVKPGPISEAFQRIERVEFLSLSTGILETPEIIFNAGDSLAILNLKPLADNSGSDTLRILIQDDGGKVNPDLDVDSLLIELIVQVNRRRPGAVNDNFEVLEDSLRSFTKSDLAINDTIIFPNPNDPTFDIEIISFPSQGEIILEGNDSFVYVPNQDFFGTDLFTYRLVVSDSLKSAPAQVLLSVIGVNDAPRIFDLEETINLMQNAPSISVDFTVDTGPRESNQKVTEVKIVDQDIILIDQAFITPSVDIENGYTLTVSPPSNEVGAKMIILEVQDDGDTLRNGINTFRKTIFINILAPPPVAPDSLDAEEDALGDALITWDDQSNDEQGFTLWRSVGDTLNFESYQILPANTTSFTDTDIREGVLYCYRVVAFGDGGESTFSNIDCIIILPNVVLFPNTFTPNGDQKNDFFRLRSDKITEVDFKIFDRFGNVVFDTQDVSEATNIGWDGGNHPAGIYVWDVKIRFQNNEEASARGKVNLIR